MGGGDTKVVDHPVYTFINLKSYALKINITLTFLKYSIFFL